MKLRTKILDLEAGGKSVAILYWEDAENLSVSSQDRVRISTEHKEIIAIVNTTTKLIEKGTIGIYDEIKNSLDLKDGCLSMLKSHLCPPQFISLGTSLEEGNLPMKKCL